MDFHMIDMSLDPRGLIQLTRALHLPINRTDDGYIVHCALGELFQDNAPRPFSVESGSGERNFRVLAYSQLNATALQEVANGFAPVLPHSTVDWDRFRSKPMPSKFPVGMRFRFEMEACPIVRKSNGPEVDAFLAECWKVGDDVAVDRGEVYCKWMRANLERRGARALNVSMERFALERMIRRTHGSTRKAKTIKRPSTTLTGTLEVTDGEAFKETVRKGIGRHKSFGFGMLKLRRGS